VNSREWVKVGLFASILAALVGLAVLAGHIPAIQALYMQIAGSLLGLLGLHHGHDVLANKLDDGADNDLLPQPAPLPPLPPVPVLPPALNVTVAQLETIMPQAGAANCQAHVQAINNAALKWGITTKARMTAWLGNCALECNQLRELEEHWVPTPAQLDYEPPQHVAKILGNTQPGDGQRFKGRGVIQLTGRSNYHQAGVALGLNLVANPELAAQIDNAWSIAGWFWEKHGLNAVADTGNFQQTVEVINGGLTDLADRQAFYDRAQTAIV
jgi:predicted chitinase